MANNVFAVPVFIVVFRESLEAVIVVSILLAFLKQTLGGPDGDALAYKKLRRQVWLGSLIGFFICLVVASAIIGVFYTVGRSSWSQNGLYYEGAFSLFGSVIITIMGAALLRVTKMQDKWRVKLAKAVDNPLRLGGRKGIVKRFMEKYAMFVLPFVTVMREGIEGVIFVAGVSFTAPATAFPLPVVCGLLVGGIVGYILYRGGAGAKLQVFLVASTCLLYLVAAGLFSRAVWDFETAKWNKVVGGDAAEVGNGPGSYDIDNSVWHVNCCGPEAPGSEAWGILNAIFGWTNSATYGSVISYNVYWIFVIAAFLIMRFRESTGRYPFMKAKPKAADSDSDRNSTSAGSNTGVVEAKTPIREQTNTVSATQ
ncbi:high-affinity iron ion transporter FtrA [Beauveria brongniartii RCEF 3172]|uniref:High-affinity iron ion transporter FtrA n=1 Tax=Beauveria brongniartii RCEF 3172 TaxID=1081107 RepID=A0A167IFN3_9HYPO|nr:high-affinity iron ion transporter FtrA [Beauveria brongniartii RCEF 3172]